MLTEFERLTPPAIWGGVECTVNRVGDTYFDQLEWSGHAGRISDLDLFAGLGLAALRYPLLWERIAPDGLPRADWDWADARMARLKNLALEPIVGLVHHGSGPASTSLLDPDFPVQLAEYARAVARRYPWVTRYTPVNEPLTTARFSGLYGYWYPHAQDSLLFVRILLNQCRAVVQAMQAIREVNPDAQLVQTEDLGRTDSTPALRYQADFDNQRRWLSFDLLCGRVVPGHPMHHYLCWLGIGEDDLRFFSDNPCPPDIFGINYYITSERFLDENLSLYPFSASGGNDRHEYADLETVRVCAEGIAGPEALLREVWDRYGRPIAVTEAHLGSTADEQMRWLGEVWAAAAALRREGADIRAVTAWSLLGTYDWNSLVTRAEGHYEPGVFALGPNGPRPTALAEMVRSLAATGRFDHPALQSGGWWRRPGRLLYPPVSAARSVSAVSSIRHQARHCLSCR